MNLKSVETCERTKLERFLAKVQLPNHYKKIGVIVVVLSFIALTVIKFYTVDAIWIGPILKHVMLLGLLVISLSKEKIEDELIEVLRSKSYALAFIIGVMYTILQQLANYIVDMILGKEEVHLDMASVQVLLFMILIQVGFFELLKRSR